MFSSSITLQPFIGNLAQVLMTADMVKSPEKSAGRHPRKNTDYTKKIQDSHFLCKCSYFPLRLCLLVKDLDLYSVLDFVSVTVQHHLFQTFVSVTVMMPGILALVPSDWFPVKMIQIHQLPSHRHHLHTFKQKQKKKTKEQRVSCQCPTPLIDFSYPEKKS